MSGGKSTRDGGPGRWAGMGEIDYPLARRRICISKKTNHRANYPDMKMNPNDVRVLIISKGLIDYEVNNLR